MTDENQTIHSRLEALENLTAYQEHTIESLNEMVSKQQQDLLTLEHKLKLLSDFIKNLTLDPESGIKKPSEETPPPHY